ncbi:uncharacterized protein ISCGN_025739 [Ixodes scapularis]
MAVCNADLSGVLKGSCLECRCTGYQRTVAMVQLSLLIPIGACIHCWHPPAAHKDAGDRAVTSGGEIPAGKQTTALGAKGTVSCEVPSFVCEPDIAEVGASEQEPNVQEAPQSPPNVARANSQPSLAAGTAGDTRMSEMWSKDNVVPPFSDAIQPLLHGQSMSRDEQNRLARQLRHELIDFLKDFVSFCFFQATFLSRLAETRRHRKARNDKKTELPRLSPVPSDSREQCTPTIDMTRAIQELKPSVAAGTAGDTRMSEMWSKDNVVPPFSDAIQPLLHGQSMSRDEQNRLARQLRHELIDFLNNNNLIEDSNPAIRRWKYQRLGESLVSAYPKILWDKQGRATKCSTKSPMATFLSRLAETRRHRKARNDKKTELPRLSPVPSDSREQCTPTIDMTRAIQELKELAAAVSPSRPFGVDRMKQLLGST